MASDKRPKEDDLICQKLSTAGERYLSQLEMQQLFIHALKSKIEELIGVSHLFDFETISSCPLPT